MGVRRPSGDGPGPGPAPAETAIEECVGWLASHDVTAQCDDVEVVLETLEHEARSCPGRLEPGDRRIRAVVRPQFPAGVDRTQTWRCSHCTRRHRVGESRAVLFGSTPTSVPYAFMVCPRCASSFTPYRFVVDIEGLAGCGDDDRAVRAVADLAVRIQRDRGLKLLPERLPIRAADVHRLAAELQITRMHLLMLLRDRGLLAEIDTGAVPASDGHSSGTPAALRRPRR
jgi:hypothetical protein